MSAPEMFAPMIASFGTPLVPTAVALGVALLLLLLERRQDPQSASFAPFAVLPPLAAVVAVPERATLVLVPLVIGLVVAMLARNRNDLLHSECGLKLLWVLGPALTLSWAGMEQEPEARDPQRAGALRAHARPAARGGAAGGRPFP